MKRYKTLLRKESAKRTAKTKSFSVHTPKAENPGDYILHLQTSTKNHAAGQVSRSGALQKKRAASRRVESSIYAARGGGRILSPTERNYFEPRFGKNFGQVKIHNDATSHTLARSVKARAFTVGNNIFFGSGEYAPHTVQQEGSLKIQRAKARIHNHKGKEKSIVLSSVKIAENMVNKAQIYIGGKRRDRFKRWFNTAHSPTSPIDKIFFNQIKHGWVKLHSVFKSRPIDIDCSKRNGDYFAYVNIVDGKYLIYLGKHFWSAPASGRDSKGGTIVHELSHEELYTDDHKYGEANARNLAKNAPSKAAKNADNWEYFAEDSL